MGKWKYRNDCQYWGLTECFERKVSFLLWFYSGSVWLCFFFPLFIIKSCLLFLNPSFSGFFLPDEHILLARYTLLFCLYKFFILVVERSSFFLPDEHVLLDHYISLFYFYKLFILVVERLLWNLLLSFILRMVTLFHFSWEILCYLAFVVQDHNQSI